MNEKIENKRQKFIRLAELRTNKAVMAIENLIGLSNTRNYDYNTKDVEKIVKALKTLLILFQALFLNLRKKEI